MSYTFVTTHLHNIQDKLKDLYQSFEISDFHPDLELEVKQLEVEVDKLIFRVKDGYYDPDTADLPEWWEIADSGDSGDSDNWMTKEDIRASGC